MGQRHLPTLANVTDNVGPMFAHYTLKIAIKGNPIIYRPYLNAYTVLHAHAPIQNFFPGERGMILFGGGRRGGEGPIPIFGNFTM